MESIQDQVAYGNHCVHGTNVGTPGGADLMCGLCEGGYTTEFKCPNCGKFMWVEPDAEITCVPNPERVKFARAIRELRRQLDNVTIRRLIALRDLPKFIHEG